MAKKIEKADSKTKIFFMQPVRFLLKKAHYISETSFSFSLFY